MVRRSHLTTSSFVIKLIQTNIQTFRTTIISFMTLSDQPIFTHQVRKYTAAAEVSHRAHYAKISPDVYF